MYGQQQMIAWLEPVEGGVLVTFQEAVKREVSVVSAVEQAALGGGMKIVQEQMRAMDPDADADWKGDEGKEKKKKLIEGILEEVNKKVGRYFLETRRVPCVGSEALIAAIGRAQKAHADVVRLDQEGKLHGSPGRANEYIGTLPA